MLQRLLVATASVASFVTATPSSTNVELHELAGFVSSSLGHDKAEDRQRLSLRHLESMWHTSLGEELDSSSSGREAAFRAALDSEWALLASQDSDYRVPLPSIPDVNVVYGSKKRWLRRSPFLVCTDRHPDAILALENVVHRTRTQLAYSRGDTACLLTGLHLDDVEAVRALKGVHVVDPLPHPAKLSRSLHARLEPIEADLLSDGPSAKAKETAEAATMSAGGGAMPTDERTRATKSTNAHKSLPRHVCFNHGEGLPRDLDVSLTPGTWGVGAGDRWAQHLTSFESTARLWNEHLRERFLWTRKALDVDKATALGDAKDAGRERNGGRRAANTRQQKFVGEHGLNHTASLWEQAAEGSSKDGACNFGRLRAVSESQHNVVEEQSESNARRQQPGKSGRLRKGGAKEKTGEVHDRVVLRGAGLLGITAQDNAHCLLTVLAYLATRPEVAYVDDMPPVIPFNIEAAWITQSGQETTYSVWDQGIDGRTEIIAMADSGLDLNSCFFREESSDDNIECSTYNSPVYDLTKRKVVQYVGFVDCEDIENGHGTHVAGSAAGALAETSPGEHFGDGTGFRAKIAVFDFGNDEGNLVTPSSLKVQMLDPPYDIGARISTNSWGAVRTTYTSLDRQVDNFAYIKPDMVIIVAAGNCGDEISECSYQDVDIYGAGSILSPALAKNVITVGASEASPSSAGLADNVDEIAYFSSQGPTTDDNRIKPDIVAPGYHLFSASANPEGESCEIGPMAGTSMATPIVAGAASMIRQYFVQGWYPSGLPTPSDMFNPSNALVKAMLIASGTAMTAYHGSAGTTVLGSPPDGIQGFGRVLLDSVLNMHGSVDLYVEDAVDMSHGDVHTYTLDMDGISTSAYDGDMKVVMVWMEPAAYSGSVAPVYNDLDLLVVGNDGSTDTTFYPNNLATKDSDNTVEVVTISDVDSYESFEVTVTGASVTTSSLPYYALVVTGGVAGDYSPTSSAGRSWFVRWEMTVEGVPVAQAATEAFEAGMAEAISFETGDYTSENATVLVKIDQAGDDATDATDDADSTVTVEISVDSEADGYAVLTYVISVVEGASASADQGLAAALNDALESRTTDGCDCVATSSNGYDCSACEEYGQFSTVESVATSQGGYDLLSTEGSGRSPVSVFAPDDAEGNDDDAFWSGFSGGKQVRGILRTDSYADVAVVVVVIVAFTSLCGLLVNRCAKPAEVAPPVGASAPGNTNVFARGGSKLPGAESVADQKQQRGVTSRRECNSPTAFTPRATPAPGREVWGEGEGEGERKG